uniref:Uncharacterized protein n=1 Tax=Timema shepardi TaxID=629360 RepID=A0A7R9AWS8_TIMSH|nr:unnamed protein product [Timema shepardi]
MFQQPTWRLWGEERVEGAVYTVYLKKVRYHRPTKSISSDPSVPNGVSNLDFFITRQSVDRYTDPTLVAAWSKVLLLQ